MTQSNNRICLAMLVDSDEQHLEAVLQSALPHIDTWYVINTSQSQQIEQQITDNLKSIEGQLVNVPATSFETLRTQLLDEASKCAEYLLLLEPNEVFQSTRTDIVTLGENEIGCVEILENSVSTVAPRLLPAENCYQYIGSKHAELIVPSSSHLISIDSVRIRRNSGAIDNAAQCSLLESITIMESALKNATSTTQASLLFALTKLSIRLLDKMAAASLLSRVLENPAAPSDIHWQANYFLGLIWRKSGNTELSENYFVAAFESDTTRAEPLYYLVEQQVERKQFSKALQLLELGEELEITGKAYFERHIYTTWLELMRAKIYIELKRFDEARETLSKKTLILSEEAATQQHQQLLSLIPQVSAAPEASFNRSQAIPSNQPKLSIVMATYDDYDGVYFTLISILTAHREIGHLIEVIILNNNPEGKATLALKKLCDNVPLARYEEAEDIKGTAVRTRLFGLAKSDYVLCIDCHVVLLSGSIAKLIAYFDQHPLTNDLLHGPLVAENLKHCYTHMEPVWKNGMLGTWAKKTDVESLPKAAFEIPVHGMGLFACRKKAWLGFNPKFKGFGGEEGYIQEKYRSHGHKALCLPFLQWIHRFERPLGVPYTITWEDRLRNQLIGFDELDLDNRELISHFEHMLSFDFTATEVAKFKLERADPFFSFDAIYCINLNHETEKWQYVIQQCEALNLAHRVQRFSAIETPENHHIGCALSHRAIIQLAQQQGYSNILVLEDDVIFDERTTYYMKHAVSELHSVDWDLFYLGSFSWAETFSLAEGCTHLKTVAQAAEGPTCTHALAYNQSSFATILDELPESEEEMKIYVQQKFVAIDQYFAHGGQLKRYMAATNMATQLPLLNLESDDFSFLLERGISQASNTQ